MPVRGGPLPELAPFRGAGADINSTSRNTRSTGTLLRRGVGALVISVVLAACSLGADPDSVSTPPSERAAPWEARPVVDLSFEMSADLRQATGTEKVQFSPDLRTCRLVFRAWPNKPGTGQAGTELELTSATVQGFAVTPVVTSGGSPAGAPGTVIELPLEPCLDPGDQVEAELEFVLTLGEYADERIGVDPELDLAWFAGGFPLLAWVQEQGWVVDEAVPLAGESTTSEAFDLRSLSVTAPSEYAVLGTGAFVGMEPAGRAGWTTHRYAAPAVRNVSISVGGFEVLSRDVGEIRMRVGVPVSGSRSSAEEWLDAHATYVGRLQELLGPFPYADLWVTVIPAQSSGIEAPTALQYGDVRSQDLDGLVAHELAHQWTYSLVGNNQAHDPWIDESFATFAQVVVTQEQDNYNLDDVGGRIAGYLGYPMTYWSSRGGFNRYYHGVYEQGAAVLLAGRESVGADSFDTATRAYIDQNAHQVATTGDVKNAFADLPEVVELLEEYGAFSGPAPAVPPAP